MKNKKLLIAGIVLVTLGLFSLAAFLYKQDQSKKFGFMAKEDFATFVPEHAPRIGAEDAKVFVVEYLDPECESCREFYPVTKQLLKEFEGKIESVTK